MDHRGIKRYPLGFKSIGYPWPLVSVNSSGTPLTTEVSRKGGVNDQWGGIELGEMDVLSLGGMGSEGQYKG